MKQENSSKLEYVDFEQGNPPAYGKYYNDKGEIMEKVVYYDELDPADQGFYDLFIISERKPKIENHYYDDLVSEFRKRTGCYISNIKHRSAWDDIQSEIDLNTDDPLNDLYRVVKKLKKYEKEIKEIKAK